MCCCCEFGRYWRLDACRKRLRQLTTSLPPRGIRITLTIHYVRRPLTPVRTRLLPLPHPLRRLARPQARLPARTRMILLQVVQT